MALSYHLGAVRNVMKVTEKNNCYPWESAQGEDTSKHGQLASGCFPSLPAAQDSKRQWTLIYSAHPPDISPKWR